MDTVKEEKKVYTYRTKSLDVFSVALAMGAEITGVKREEGDRFLTFILRADFDIEQVAFKHESKTLEVNSFDLCEAMRRAKSVCHSH